MGGGFRVVAGTEDDERLLERSRGLARTTSLKSSVGPASEQLGPPGIVGRGEVERAGEPRFCLGGVEAERALAGERKKAASGCGEVVCLLRVAGRLGELERLQVVVGEYLGQVLDPVASSALDPGGRRAVTAARCARGIWP